VSSAFCARVAAEAIWLVLVLSGPPILLALLVGIGVALLQALTQVQDPILGFAPKAVAVFLTLAALGPWMGATFVSFGRFCFRAFGAGFVP